MGLRFRTFGFEQRGILSIEGGTVDAYRALSAVAMLWCHFGFSVVGCVFVHGAVEKYNKTRIEGVALCLGERESSAIMDGLMISSSKPRGGHHDEGSTRLAES